MSKCEVEVKDLKILCKQSTSSTHPSFLLISFHVQNQQPQISSPLCYKISNVAMVEVLRRQVSTSPHREPLKCMSCSERSVLSIEKKKLRKNNHCTIFDHVSRTSVFFAQNQCSCNTLRLLR